MTSGKTTAINQKDSKFFHSTIPAELDISDHPWQQRTCLYTQSTEELLRPEIDSEPNRDSVSIQDLSTRPYHHGNSRDVAASVTIPIRLANFVAPRGRDDSLSHGSSQAEPRAVSPLSSRLSMSEDDIELDRMHFALPSAGTQSTDSLVPSSAPRELKPDGLAKRNEAALPARAIPNYKPIPLRWPFQVLLLVMISGVFFFFEFQVRNLPPVAYRALQFGPAYTGDGPASMAAGFPAVTAASLTTKGDLITESTPPVAKMNPAVVPATTTHSFPTPAPTVTAGPRILVAAPRPPESAYPSPKGRVSAFCGWGSPYWALFRRPGNPTVIGDRMATTHLPAIMEQIPMFTTTDPSWCPCTVLERNGGQWGGRWGIGPSGVENWWDTNDEGCKSVMNLVSSFNSLKTIAWITELPELQKTSYMYFSTAPSHLPVQPFWVLPTTNMNGDIAFPLEVRTAIPGERRDIFGNDVVTSGPGATFLGEYCCSSGLPQNWDHITASPGACRLEKPMVIPVTCADPATLTFPLTAEVCTEFVPYTQPCAAGVTSFETLWWTLPLGSPMKTTAKPTTTTSTIVKMSTTSFVSTDSTRPTISPTSTESTGPTKTPPSTELTMLTMPLDSPSSKVDETITSVISTEINSTSPGSTAFSSSGKVENIVSSTIIQTERPSSSPRTTDEGVVPITRLPTTASSGTQRFPTTYEMESFTTSHSPIIVGSHGTQRSSASGTTQISGPTSTIPQQPIVTQASGFPELTKSTNTDRAAITNKFRTVSGVIVVYQVKGNPVSTTEFSRYLSIYASLAPGTYTVDLYSGGLTTLFTTVDATTQPTTGPPGPPGPITPDIYGAFFNLHSEADYLMASLVPVLLATLLKIHIQILTGNVNIILPFRALTQHKEGAAAQDSLLLSQRTMSAPLVAHRFLYNAKDPLALFNVLLSTVSVIFVPLSTETIQLEFTSMNCTAANDMCAYGLRNAGIPMRVAEALLATMAILIIVIGITLARWKTGFATEPWSIASMASLLTSSEPELQKTLRSIPYRGEHLSEKQILNEFEGHRFRLDFHKNPKTSDSYTGSEQPTLTYGIQVLSAPMREDKPIKPTTRDPPKPKPDSTIRKRGFWHLEPLTKDISIRITALILHLGLLILILYYENTTLDTAFETFMNSESFRVRLLFTTFGTAVSAFWDYYFFQISDTHIHTLLSTRPRPASESFLLAPPSNPFIGIYRFFRSKQSFALSIALTTLLAKFTPILFASIPFRNTVTWKNHEACTWSSVAVLSWMAIVLVVSLLRSYTGVIRIKIEGKGGITIIRHKENEAGVIQMPIATDTILGGMYSLLWSERMLRDFEGLEMLTRKERDKLVSDMGRLYTCTLRDLAGGGADEVQFRSSQGPEEQVKRKGKGVMVVDYWVPNHAAVSSDGRNSDSSDGMIAPKVREEKETASRDAEVGLKHN